MACIHTYVYVGSWVIHVFDSKYITYVSETPVTVIGKLVGACNYLNGRHEECIIILLFIVSSACSIARNGHCGFWGNYKGCVLKSMEYWIRGSYVSCLSSVLFINKITEAYILQMIGTLYHKENRIRNPATLQTWRFHLHILFVKCDGCSCSWIVLKVILSAITRCSSVRFFSAFVWFPYRSYSQLSCS